MAVGGGDQDGLEDAVAPGQGPGGEAGLRTVEQDGAGVDGGAGGLAAEGGGGRLDGGVAAQPPGFPGLVVGAEESPVAVEGDADRRGHRRAVLLVGGEQDGLRIPERGQGSVHVSSDQAGLFGVTRLGKASITLVYKLSL